MVHATFFRLNEEKRERILAAARREFSEHVYEKSSINRILDEAEVPKGSFYQYFDDKSDLFYLCISSVYKKSWTQGPGTMRICSVQVCFA